MFARIDTFLATHTPQWYRTPVAQTATLGVVFFWVFAAYTTIQFYAASTYGSDLAADTVSAVYFTFTLTCLVAPGIINKWGCRLAMLVGVLGYASLVLASLIYFLYGGEEVTWARRMVVMGGAILGCGAATLWTAQGRLILQYASRAEELQKLEGTIAPEKRGNKNDSGKSKTQTGTLMGLFWAIFQCSSLVGGSISFLYYNKKPEGSAALYSLFLGFIIMGALFTQFLLPPSMLHNIPAINGDICNKQRDVELISEQTPLNAPADVQYVRGQSQNEDNELRIAEEISHQSWSQEARGSLEIFFTKKMMCLFLLFFYTGFNQPYQQATFGNRFFTRRTIGAELIIFHLMEIIGALVCGRFLDKDDKQTKEHSCNNAYRRKRAVICLGSFIIINSTGNILAAMQEYAAKHSSDTIAHDISDSSVVPPSLAFACWGFADAQIQVYCYWLMGGFYSSGSDHSRAVGFYKCVQSLGTSIGFYLIPTSRLGELSQLAVSSVVFVVGTGMSFSQLP